MEDTACEVWLMKLASIDIFSNILIILQDSI